MAKMTMKELSSEVENLKNTNAEKDSVIKVLDEKMTTLQKWCQEMISEVYKKMNVVDHHHCNNENTLDGKIRDLEAKFNDEREKHDKKIVVIEEKIEDTRGEDTKKPKTSVEDVPNKKCKECTFTFSGKSDLKNHILAVHPKSFACRMCDNTFETSVGLELHLNSHDLPKQFKCDVCEKAFHMKWRLEKHKKQHEVEVVKYCHFYNNNKFCSYEELGCMFRHNQAPICNRSNRCKNKLCQFRHETETEAVMNDASGEQSAKTDDKEHNSEDETDVENCKNFVHCGAKANHPNDNIHYCPECNCNTKCWMENNIHWQKTPGHIFSTEELREMGYDV